MSQSELAAILKVSAKTVMRWEHSDQLPDAVVPVVEDFLSVHALDSGPALREATDIQLAVELLNRLQDAGDRKPWLDDDRDGGVGIDSLD
jgi:ribosome-binding protein aMBF1 (putative translation factor)